jgi:hypothetical protein
MGIIVILECDRNAATDGKQSSLIFLGHVILLVQLIEAQCIVEVDRGVLRLVRPVEWSRVDQKIKKEKTR